MKNRNACHFLKMDARCMLTFFSPTEMHTNVEINWSLVFVQVNTKLKF